ncbi:HNH endonuclease [Escherichia coli]|uniref:HNH endonuclease n=1 Tax=Escherichia coli TaxID=562 RepID=UPI001F063B1C|nr:HNH endonuclease [Escherichia coli]MCH0685591.1 HNH endonuclease [Escherichia coli]MDZ8667092.1 HNH endonuclease [Escherichia coli]WRX87674.1 HNH endonuclease [Escherichia coli]
MFTVEYLKSLEVRKTLAERINGKILKNCDSGCWVFKGKKDRCGYGVMRIGPHTLGAHKISYLINVGDYDQDNLELMHSCDNPSCVNPEHLFPVTHKENMHDCLRKGRHTCQNHVCNRLIYKNKSIEKKKAIKKIKFISLWSSRQVAISNGDKLYGGSFCKIHEKNNLRLTSNGFCYLCQAEYHKRKRKNKLVHTMKCVL